MKMTVQELMDRTIILSAIIRENRKLPIKGKYWLGRMHSKMLPVFNKYNNERDAKILAFNYFPMVPNPANHLSDEQRAAWIEQGLIANLPPKEIQSTVAAVPPDEVEKFTAEWIETGKQEVEVDVKPVHIDTLCFPGDLSDGEITAHEFIVLGDLVYE